MLMRQLFFFLFSSLDMSEISYIRDAGSYLFFLAPSEANFPVKRHFLLSLSSYTIQRPPW